MDFITDLERFFKLEVDEDERLLELISNQENLLIKINVNKCLYSVYYAFNNPTAYDVLLYIFPENQILLRLYALLTKQLFRGGCIQWSNKINLETFDNDLCRNYYGQYSITIESDDEWKYIKEVVKEASIGTMRNDTKNSRSLYVLLGGVERFGRMSPRLLYDEHLKGLHVHRDSNWPCKRYGIIAQWPKFNGTIRIIFKFPVRPASIC
ncbi:hypothetical protein DINM_001406 [Dirofilaria immitis]|nr:hypothetical protein [Dirofilaria immitis]